MTVVLDTNFLILVFTKKIDIFEEIKYLFPKSSIIVFNTVLNELKKVKPELYDSVIKLLEIKKIKITSLETDLSVDNFLLEYALKNEGVIATLDRELKQKALKRGLSVISIKGKKLQIR